MHSVVIMTILLGAAPIASSESMDDFLKRLCPPLLCGMKKRSGVPIKPVRAEGK